MRCVECPHVVANDTELGCGLTEDDYGTVRVVDGGAAPSWCPLQGETPDIVARLDELEERVRELEK